LAQIIKIKNRELIMALYECVVCGERIEIDHDQLKMTPMHCGEVCAALLED
jgi:hypothetical protein